MNTETTSGPNSRCGRNRLTKRRMLGTEEYYAIDSIQELDLWEREFNIPPTEVAPIIFDHKGSRHLVRDCGVLYPLALRRWKKSGAYPPSTPSPRH